MRPASRRSHLLEEEDESVFISMTDMTVSILFIVLILLAFFASQLRPETETREKLSLVEISAENVALKEQLALLGAAPEVVIEQATEISDLQDEISRLSIFVAEQEIDQLQLYNANVAQERTQLLDRLRNLINIEFPELNVRLSATKDALQFQGEGLFASGSAVLSRERKSKIERIAEIIDEILSCFTLGKRSAYGMECNASFAVIEALQIEGHTDSDGSGSYNVELSSRRAAATYGAMILYLDQITDHRNLAGQPVLSVAGYGKDRPIAENDTAEGRAANRRIDLRFIMVRPARVDDISDIQQRLGQGDIE